jgi:hypothetical protein
MRPLDGVLAAYSVPTNKIKPNNINVANNILIHTPYSSMYSVGVVDLADFRKDPLSPFLSPQIDCNQPYRVLRVLVRLARVLCKSVDIPDS